MMKTTLNSIAFTAAVAARHRSHGRQRRAGALLDRRQDLDDAPLDVVQRAVRLFAEVGGEQDQGDYDEQREDCTSSANLLVMHVMSVSKMLLRATSVPVRNLVPAAPVA